METNSELQKFEEVVIPAFDAWMEEKTYVPAVDICPYDGEYILATNTEEVVQLFIEDNEKYEEFEDRLIDYAGDDGPYGQTSDWEEYEPKVKKDINPRKSEYISGELLSEKMAREAEWGVELKRKTNKEE